jgi:hypothetical protein
VSVETLSGRPAVEQPAVVAPPRTRTRVNPVKGVLVTALLVGVLVAAGLSFLDRGPSGADVRTMQPGQCFTETDTVVDDGRVIPYGKDTVCMEGAQRVLAVVTLPLGPYPGVAGLDQVVADNCGGEQTHVIAPTETSWAGGDRTVACLVLP